MKCFIKVFLALIVLTGAEIAIASPIAAPVLQLEVVKLTFMIQVVMEVLC